MVWDRDRCQYCVVVAEHNKQDQVGHAECRDRQAQHPVLTKMTKAAHPGQARVSETFSLRNLNTPVPTATLRPNLVLANTFPAVRGWVHYTKQQRSPKTVGKGPMPKH